MNRGRRIFPARLPGGPRHLFARFARLSPGARSGRKIILARWYVLCYSPSAALEKLLRSTTL
ncbi:MAG: hypothetical protein B5M55_03860 [Desulfococcus sp. 4484_242]|nr:MAG: hypothetical protein B5M55_03860 [Desulfococcus sp. 4484_242]